MHVLQIKQLRQVFDDIDQNGDGSVDRSEFRRYMSQLDGPRPPSSTTLFDDAESVFFSLDRRKNGTLCFTDVRPLNHQHVQSAPELVL
jgi:Ca2+-binding EF-hand superfamily protein